MISTSSRPVHQLIHRVSLRTRDAARLARFYSDRLGLLARPGDAGTTLLRHPRTGEDLLVLIEDPAAVRPDMPVPGLFHIAFLYPDREDWSDAVFRSCSPPGVRFGGADHAVSHAVYFSDPDGNGIELAWDLPESRWPWRGDHVSMVTEPLPADALTARPDLSQPPGPFFIGHLHLQLGDLRHEAAYREHLGLALTQGDYPGAVFLARGRYHHHFGLNEWNVRRGTLRPERAVGLVGWEMTAPGPAAPTDWIDPAGHRVTFVPAD